MSAVISCYSRTDTAHPRVGFHCQQSWCFLHYTILSWGWYRTWVGSRNAASACNPNLHLCR